MKKLSLKIIVAIVSCSSLLLVICGFLTFNSFSKILRNQTIDQIESILEEEKSDFNFVTSANTNSVELLKSLISSTLDISKLDDKEYIKAYKESLVFNVHGIADGLDITSLYFYFHPDIDSGDQIYIEDYDGDDDYAPGKSRSLTGVNLMAKEYLWYSNAIKYKKYWSDPYRRKGHDSQVISYTEALVINGRTIGVIGTDLSLDYVAEHFNKVRILETGVLTLFDEELNFLIDHRFMGQNLSQVDPENYQRVKSIIENGKGILEFEFEGVKRILFFNVMDNGWVITTRKTYQEIFKELYSVRNWYFLIIILSVFVSAIVALYLGKSIAKPIKEISRFMEKLSTGEGDLRHTIDINTKDETAELADNFNKFLASLKYIVSNIKNSSVSNISIGRSLIDSSENATSSSSQMNSNVLEIENQIDSLNSNILSTTSSIYQISSNINGFKNQISDQVSAVEESSASIEEMIASIDNVARVTNKKLESIHSLVDATKSGEEILSLTSRTFKEGISDKIDSITEMINVIKNISSKTNLLAMNAAIEAAHAGKAGKGFSVVADEIRKMAEEASNSSSAISYIIKDIVLSIENTDKNIDMTSKTFGEINREVKEFNIALSEISSNTVELATGGEEVLKAISLLNKTTTQLTEGIHEIESGSVDINNSMGNVKSISSEVNQGVKEITIGINDVSNSFEYVSQLANDVNRESEKLSLEVNRFIIE